MPADSVDLYFPCGPTLELHAVRRGVTTVGDDRIAEVVELLLAGPNTQETDAGFSSMLLPGDIEVMDVADGRLVLNFPAEVNNLGTSAGSRVVLESLRQTLLALDGVEEIELRLRGDCADFFEWIQVGPTCHVLARDGLVVAET